MSNPQHIKVSAAAVAEALRELRKQPLQDDSNRNQTETRLNLPDQYSLVDTATLAYILGLNRRTVEGYIRKRKIPFFRISHRCVRFRLRDVFKALEDRYTVKEVGAK
jgi:helix-turn-helix protein